MVTKYMDPLESSLWSIGLINMTAAVAQSLQDMSTYVNPITGMQYDQAKPTLKNAAYAGAANALQMQSQMMMEIQARKKPVISVARDIPVYVQITDKLPLDILVEAGVVKKEQ